ncbi:MAG: hypothetical protein A2629_02000 [Candidatus Levybacteria bacterium RIFCSPHIGHO2_01_FULL_41_15]|nr:MAG: hypothetical protein A2629_02000 [Candidatus Levybacteria bacterium RIFCSPHIGHO2_01_FULL_41_15]
MCYNCGCGMTDNDMGKGKLAQGGGSLTEDDFNHMAEKWDMSVEDAKNNTYQLLKRQLEKDKS